MPTVKDSYAKEGSEKLTLIRNGVWRPVLRAFMGHMQKMKDRSYVDMTMMSISQLEERVVVFMHCLKQKEFVN